MSSSHADHAHVDGKCTSWVDEALDAAGPEYADAPRPGSCCEKDAEVAAEAARVRRIVSAADPVRRATALRHASDPSNVALAHIPETPANDAEDDLDRDDLLTSDDDDGDRDDDQRFANTSDPTLLEIQARRLREMKLAAARAAERRSKASYVSVSSETDLPRVIAEGPSRVVVHFALEGCDESARVDETLDVLAAAHPRTRFVRVLGAWPSPMLNTVGAHCLPAIVCFRRKKLGRWTAGFDDFGGVEGFEESRVARWLARAADMLPGHPDAPKDATRDAAGIGLGDESSDDEERGGAGGWGGRREEGSDDEEICGFAPCEQCGRRYPHTHVRALRRGGMLDDRAGSDESDDEEE